MKDSQTVVGKGSAASESEQAHAADPAPTGAALKRPEELHQIIAVAAYYLAQRRNFEPGHELEDWLDAEAEVVALTESMKGFPA